MRYIIPDKIRLGQIHSRRVHALKDPLGIILASVERNIDHEQFLDTLVEGSDINGRFLYLFFEKTG